MTPRVVFPVFVAAFVACKHSEQPKPDVVPVASVSTRVEPLPLPPAAMTGSKTRESAAGDTKGTISCGQVRCTATKEACVLRNGLWACIALEQAPTSDRSYECDDATDCTQNGNDVCCSADQKSGYCTNMRPADSTPCEYAVCNTDQGAPSCPTGQSCVKGICRPPPPRATCTGKKQCPADAPICLWDNGKGNCVASAPDAGDAVTYECTRPSDCGPGFTCCAQAGDDLQATHCAAGCGQDLQVVCEKSTDCPPFFTTGAMGGNLVPQKCKPRPTYGGPQLLPAWAGECGP